VASLQRIHSLPIFRLTAKITTKLSQKVRELLEIGKQNISIFENLWCTFSSIHKIFFWISKITISCIIALYRAGIQNPNWWINELLCRKLWGFTLGI